MVRLIPDRGSLIAFGGDPVVKEIAADSKVPVCLYGEGPRMEWSVESEARVQGGIAVSVSRRGRKVASGTLPVIGHHNALNAIAAVAASNMSALTRKLLWMRWHRFKGKKTAGNCR